LWKATTKQAEHMGTTLDITRDVERAYLYPIIAITNNVEIRDYIRDCFLYYKPFRDVSRADTPADILIHITFKIKNFGKTPGTLYRVFAETKFWPTTTGAAAGISVDKSIFGPGDETEKLLARMWIGLSRKQVNHIYDYSDYMALSGQFTFDDIWGKLYTTEFMFFWDRDIERMIWQLSR
jgi:hypothetical protein